MIKLENSQIIYVDHPLVDLFLHQPWQPLIDVRN